MPRPPRTSSNPRSTAALVTPQIALPRDFRPRGLTVPNVPFTFSGFHEKRQVRRELVRPLRRLFAAARAAGVPLAGVSGYRSEATQRDLFEYYVRVRGRAEAERISARPGHSEHQTGLAIDLRRRRALPGGAVRRLARLVTASGLTLEQYYGVNSEEE